jgi:hypothetical protein
MYITIGDGGNREGLALKYAIDLTVILMLLIPWPLLRFCCGFLLFCLRFIKDHKSAHLSMFQEASFGHGRLRIVNETSAVWTWHRNDDAYSTVREEVWLESLASPKVVMASTGRYSEEL